CATFVAVNTTFPPVIHWILALLLAMLGGGLVGVVPALMKSKLGANELVVSIMMNYVMISISMFVMNYYLRDVSVSARISKSFPEYVKIPKIFGTAHYGFVIAVCTAVLVYIFIYKTKIGYEIRVSGSNNLFSSFSGIKTTKVIILSQIVGCAVAGLGGGAEVLGSYNAFSWDGATGYGFDGMVVSIIARRNPLVAIVAALFLGYLRAGADIMNRTSDVALEVISIVQAIMIVLVAADAFLSEWRHKLTVKESDTLTQEAQR
ncbi:MAG: ABC transporter permease, partial [Oscillospiraceae bacterium]|nr:ABC transporter permease [Oscillospiraceae bacterium]